MEEAQEALAEPWSCVGAVTPDLLVCLRSLPDGALLGGQGNVFIKKIKKQAIFWLPETAWGIVLCIYQFGALL